MAVRARPDWFLDKFRVTSSTYRDFPFGRPVLALNIWIGHPLTVMEDGVPPLLVISHLIPEKRPSNQKMVALVNDILKPTDDYFEGKNWELSDTNRREITIQIALSLHRFYLGQPLD